jgi:hypothetical protein
MTVPQLLHFARFPAAASDALARAPQEGQVIGIAIVVSQSGNESIPPQKIVEKPAFVKHSGRAPEISPIHLFSGSPPIDSILSNSSLYW